MSNINEYKTIYGRKYDIDSFPDKHKKYYERIKTFLKTKPSWNEFSNFWRFDMLRYLDGYTRKKLVELPIYKICGDLEGRIGIAQGCVRKPTKVEIFLDEMGIQEFPYLKS
ncbi:hypothetical protein KAR91_30965 [Candidatus Pacearchaeota archaeon]|nr:hypothetical protein [Candidatus Pacearchaeota archaeon]